jgi:hypothetical protein
MEVSMDTGESAPRTKGLDWARVLRISAIELVVLMALVMILFVQGVEPFLLAFGATFIAGLVWFNMKGRPGAIALLVIGLVFVLANIPFIIPSLLALNSPVEFILNLLFLVGGIGTIIAAVNLVRHNDGAGSDGPVQWIRWSALVVVLLSIVSVFIKLTEKQATPQAGDQKLTAQGTEFSTESILVEEDGGIYIENKDPFTHTFTVEALDVDIDLPGFSSRRLEVDADPGRYEFHCTIPGHETMKGTLTISG